MEAWKEVCRKRILERRRYETAYFVTNVPKDTTKNEIMETLKGYGRLIDVYMGQKIGKNGKYFAFIRFASVKDAKALERKLEGRIVQGRRL